MPGLKLSATGTHLQHLSAQMGHVGQVSLSFWLQLLLLSGDKLDASLGLSPSPKP